MREEMERFYRNINVKNVNVNEINTREDEKLKSMRDVDVFL